MHNSPPWPIYLIELNSWYSPVNDCELDGCEFEFELCPRSIVFIDVNLQKS